jgi:hypothetical protein
MIWTNVRERLPRVWRIVYVKAHYHEDKEFLAYKTLFGYWKFKSGLIIKISQSNYWAEIKRGYK